MNMHARVLLLMCAVWSFAVVAAAPDWWSERNVLNAEDANDYGVANQGQVKHIATQAHAEMEYMLPGGAGSTLDTLVNGFDDSDNYPVVNLGQLKNVAKPFYDRIAALAGTYPHLTNSVPQASGTYPWSGTPKDYAVANIGQVKYTFSFDFDTDEDRLADWWEYKAIAEDTGNLFGGDDLEDVDPTDDTDGDGAFNSAEFTARCSPVLEDTDGDGVGDNAEILLGMDPTDDEDGDSPPTGDYDEDGLTNAEEVVLGTNPVVDAVLDGAGAPSLIVHTPLS